MKKIWWNTTAWWNSIRQWIKFRRFTDKDYEHAQKVLEVFGINNLGEYHVLYVQCDTLLLADVFEKSRDTCIEIYELYPSHFLSASGLVWQACWKKQM